VSDGKVHRRDCDCCHGSGQVECDDDYCCPQDKPTTHMVRCQECGEVPMDHDKVAALFEDMHKLLDEEASARAHEEIQIRLEKHFAEPFPKQRPHYE
jgi:hypothetical protein